MLDGKLLIFFHGFMSCICKYCLLELLRTKFSELLLGLVNLKGAQRAMAVVSCVRDLGCTILPQLHRPFASLFQALWPPPHGCVRILSSTEGFRRGFNSPFGEPYTARSCWLCEVHGKHRFAVHMRVAAGAAVLLPEAVPALKNWNVTNRPLLFFGEPLNCWLVYI